MKKIDGKEYYERHEVQEKLGTDYNRHIIKPEIQSLFSKELVDNYINKRRKK